MKKLFLLCLIAAVSACAPKNASLYSPVVPDQPIVTESSLAMDFNPMVDVLFVVDNSGTMYSKQTILKRAMADFVSKFAASNRLDYHFGVVSVSDSKRYKVYKSPSDPSYLAKRAEFDQWVKAEHAAGRSFQVSPDYFTKDPRYSHFTDLGATQSVLPPGQLRPLKLPNGNFDSPLRFYLSRGDADFAGIWQSTVALGALSEEQGSPVNEEIFRPILSAFSPENIEGVNSGFYRENAHLVVVIVTDAEDASEVKPDDVFQRLLELKGGDRNKIHILGVLSSASVATCFRDDNNVSSEEIKKLVNMSTQKVFDICDTGFGDQLAQFGVNIVKKITGLEVPLASLPNKATIEVQIGSMVIPPGDLNSAKRAQQKIYWTYSPSRKSVSIEGLYDVTDLPKEPIKVSYFEPGLGKPNATVTVQTPAPTQDPTPATAAK